MSAIETSFDQYRNELAGLLKKIDVDLAMRIMHFERKMPDVEPHVELLVSARRGTNLSDLAYAISSKIGFQTMVQGHHILVAGRATIDDVYDLSLNPVIEFIEGTVSIASY
jgi:hypothetical protein